MMWVVKVFFFSMGMGWISLFFLMSLYVILVGIEVRFGGMMILILEWRRFRMVLFLVFIMKLMRKLWVVRVIVIES